MNLLLHEWKANFKSLCLWVLGMIVLLGISVAKISGMTGEGGQSITELMEQMPKSFQALFGVGMIDFSNLMGFMSVMFLYIAVIAAFHASSIGTSIFGKEERDKTFEFLYVKGMKRSTILTNKLIISFMNMILLNFFTFIFSVVIVKAVTDTNIFQDFIPLMLGLLVLQATFFSIGLLISFLTSRVKLASSISFGVVMTCLFMSIFADFSEKVAFLRFFTPFKYFDGKLIVTEGLNINYIIICILVSITCLTISFILHNKRDLKS